MRKSATSPTSTTHSSRPAHPSRLADSEAAAAFGGGGGGGGRGGGGRGGGGRGGGNFVTLTSQSTDAAGAVQEFLVSDETFNTLKTLEAKNLVVPASGDFGGPKAIRTVGQYIRDHGATVTAFYVSNVEQYLFQDAKQTAFYANVADAAAHADFRVHSSVCTPPGDDGSGALPDRGIRESVSGRTRLQLPGRADLPEVKARKGEWVNA